MILKGTHKPLIHPPLAPAATQGLFCTRHYRSGQRTHSPNPAGPQRVFRNARVVPRVVP
jgi:hypothetical protein